MLTKRLLLLLIALLSVAGLGASRFIPSGQVGVFTDESSLEACLEANEDIIFCQAQPGVTIPLNDFTWDFADRAERQEIVIDFGTAKLEHLSGSHWMSISQVNPTNATGYDLTVRKGIWSTDGSVGGAMISLGSMEDSENTTVTLEDMIWDAIGSPSAAQVVRLSTATTGMDLSIINSRGVVAGLTNVAATDPNLGRFYVQGVSLDGATGNNTTRCFDWGAANSLSTKTFDGIVVVDSFFKDCAGWRALSTGSVYIHSTFKRIGIALGDGVRSICEISSGTSFYMQIDVAGAATDGFGWRNLDTKDEAWCDWQISHNQMYPESVDIIVNDTRSCSAIGTTSTGGLLTKTNLSGGEVLAGRNWNISLKANQLGASNCTLADTVTDPTAVLFDSTVTDDWTTNAAAGFEISGKVVEWDNTRYIRDGVLQSYDYVKCFPRIAPTNGETIPNVFESAGLTRVTAAWAETQATGTMPVDILLDTGSTTTILTGTIASDNTKVVGTLTGGEARMTAGDSLDIVMGTCTGTCLVTTTCIGLSDE